MVATAQSGATPAAASSGRAQEARVVPARNTLPAPVKTAAVAGAGVVAGIALAGLTRRSRTRKISGPRLGRRRRKVKVVHSRSFLVDLHLLDR